MSTPVLKKILYVEDEPDILAVAKIALEDLGGFTLNCSRSGPEALKQIETFKPDLILLDVMMPEMDGPTTLKEIRKIPGYSDTPIVFITAKAQSGEVKDYLALGAIDIIIKPFDPLKLADNVKEIWRKKYG